MRDAGSSRREKGKATVEVINRLGKTITSVVLVHKYSNVYNESLTVPRLTHGSKTAALEIEYNYGFMYTGHDWFKVVWCDVGGCVGEEADQNIYMTDSSTSTKVQEEVLGDLSFGSITSAVIQVVAGIHIGPLVDKLAFKAVDIAFSKTADAILHSLVSDGDTTGYSDYTLHEEDNDCHITILLEPGHKTTIRSSKRRPDDSETFQWLDDKAERARKNIFTRAVVVNSLNEPITEVTLSHHYSDDPASSRFWESIDQGETSSLPGLRAEFRAGFLRIGADWWKLTWCNAAKSKCYMMEPSNMRGFLDVMEQYSGGVLSYAVGITTGIVAGNPFAGVGAKYGTAKVAGLLLGKGGTEGWKQFTLHKGDDDFTSPLRFEVLPGGKGLFYQPSSSGASEFTWREVLDLVQEEE